MKLQPENASSAKTLRMAFVALASCLAVGLIATLAAGYLQTRRASEMLVVGEGSFLLEMVGQALKAAGPPPRIEILRDAVARGRPSGLKYAAVTGPRGELVAEAGTSLFSQPASEREQAPRQAVWLGNRVRMVAGPPAASRSSPNFAPELGDRPPPPPFEMAEGFMGPPPRVIIEFEPVLAADLLRTAKLTALVGSGMLLVLIGLSVVAARLLRFREDLIRQLEHEQHLSSVGEMSAVLAHEIRNPLAALKGHAQLLAESLPENTREQTKALRVVSEAIRLEKLTTDLLSFVRSGTLELRQIDPTELLRDVAGESGKGRVLLHAQDAPAKWPMDPSKMRQVLANIFENAAHASPENAAIDARLWVDHGKLCIEVRDRGEGITPGDEERIFEPFHTGKARGTGLGLAVTRRIVSLHGGKITACNHPEGGAVFRIIVPRK